MKTVISFLFLIFFINGNAQFLNKIKQKAESAVNKAISSKSDDSKSDEEEKNKETSKTDQSNSNKMEYPFTVLSGAKFYFSDKPFTNSNAGAKTDFTSQDFIYGRLELGGKTLSDAFNLSAQPTKGFHYLNYGILITPKGKSENELNYNQTIKYTVINGSRPILIKEGEEKNTWLNFDVLANPSNISTLEAIPTPEKISEFKIPAGMNFHTSNLYIRQNFPANDTYTVQLVLWNYSFDDWGNTLESEKDIVSIGSFDYRFSTKDAAVLVENTQKRVNALEMKEKQKNKLTQLPEWWNKPFNPSESILSSSQLTPMIKNYISQWNLTYITHKIYPYSGSMGWTQYTDSQTGFPVSRRSTAEIYLLYKDPADGTCHIASLTLDENYAGGGTYGSPYLKGLWDDYLIDCSAIK